MNWDTIQGNWKQWQGAVQKQWGKLTNDDLTRINGDRLRLAGMLQTQYGRARDEADREIDVFLKSLDAENRR